MNRVNNKRLIPWSGYNQDKIIHLSEENESLILGFINMLDDLYTISQFYSIYQFNFKQIFYYFRLNSQDEIIKENGLEGDNFIIINSLIINLMSSSRALIDLLNRFDEKSSKKLSKYINEIYDSDFSYKLIITLRNFALHGHLPLYLNKNKYSFNLDYILKEGENFNFSKSSKRSFEEVRKDIKNKHQDLANIPFTSTLIKFHYTILKIYRQFYINNSEFLKSFCKEAELILFKFSEKSNEGKFYIRIKNEIHSITMDRKFLWIEELSGIAETNLQDFKNQFLKLLA